MASSFLHCRTRGEIKGLSSRTIARTVFFEAELLGFVFSISLFFVFGAVR